MLAGYRIEAIAGRGGMGVVYRATHLRLRRVDALKVIAPDLAESEDFRSRFERESQVAAQIDHPNVIPIYAAGEEEGLLYIAMRFVEGTDLREVLRREGRIEPMRAAEIVAAVGSALDAAHERGLVHRDVKPANVLITRRRGTEHVYLSDFGLAKVLMSAQGGETKTGMFVGTTDYVSPEQVLGERLDARSDVYSLGCTLFHMLTGRVPYPVEFEPAKLIAHTRDEIPSVLTVVPELPAELDVVVARATAKRPDERYLSAGDLGRAAVAAAAGQAFIEAQRSVARGPAAPTELLTRQATPTALPQVARTELATSLEPAFGQTRDATVHASAARQAESPTTLERPGEAIGPRSAVNAPPSQPRRPGSRRRWALLGGAACVAAAIVIAVIALGGGTSHPSHSSTTAAKHGTTAQHKSVFTDGAIAVGNSPDGVVIKHGTVWVSNAGDGTVMRLDEVSGKLLNTVRFANHAVGAAPIALAGSVLWVASAKDGTLTRIDAATAQNLGSIRIGGYPQAMHAANGILWIADSTNNTVSRFNAASGTLLGSPIHVGRDPKRIASGQTSIWVANSGDGTVTWLSASTGQVLNTFHVGDHPSAINYAAGDIWVASSDNNTVLRLSSTSGAAVGGPIHVGRGPRRIAAGQNDLWVANSKDGTVTKIDANTGQVLKTVRVGGYPDSITVEGGVVWVDSWAQPGVTYKGAPGSVTRIEESTGKILPASAPS